MNHFGFRISDFGFAAKQTALVLAVVLGFTSHFSSLYAQTASPYSRYGLGFYRSTTFGANKAMGEQGAAYASFLNINYTNPASYAILSRTTIEAGFNLDDLRIGTKDSTYNSLNGSVSHVVLGIPVINNRWGLSVGLLPVSNLSYSFLQRVNDSVTGANYLYYQGKGSLYQIYLGNGVHYKGFSLGFNAAYVFGKLDYRKRIVFTDSVEAFASQNTIAMQVGGFNYNVGAQYTKRIYHNEADPDARTDLFITAGVYGSGGIKLGAKTDNYWQRGVMNSGVFLSVDTPQGTFAVKEKIVMPYNVGAGVMVGNELFWQLGVDFKYTNWKKFDSPLANDALGDSWRFAFGGQITPRYDDNRKFFNRMRYRAGFYYGQSELLYAGMNLREYGGTFGFGIPLWSAARINFTADIGTRNSTDASAMRENYYRFSFGFVLNDRWFVRRKFD